LTAQFVNRRADHCAWGESPERPLDALRCVCRSGPHGADLGQRRAESPELREHNRERGLIRCRALLQRFFFGLDNRVRFHRSHRVIK